MKRALVTGATGFVGSNLVRKLLADGHEVHLLLRPGCDRWRIAQIENDLRIWEADVRNSESIDKVVQAVAPQWVFHLCAYGAYPSQDDLDTMIETNIQGTINLLKACIETGFDAFVNTGSSSEYGFKNFPPAETDSLEPNSHYAWTKASATLYCQSAARKTGLHIPSLRLYSVYGPFEEPSRLMPAMVVQGFKGLLPPMTGPEVARDYVYISDVDEAFLKAAGTRQQEPGAIYNVGTGIQTTLEEVVGVARRRLAIEAEPEWASMPNRSWDTDLWVADPAKIEKELDWHPDHKFEHGFGLLVDWFQANPQMIPFYESRRN